MEKIESSFKSVHFQNNIYLVVDHIKSIEYDPEIENALQLAENELENWLDKIKSNSIFYIRFYKEQSLYSGRVKFGGEKMSTKYNRLFVDGIKIIVLDGRFNPEVLDCQWICNYLNAIETYGVDGFLENYKASLNEHIQYLNRTIESLQYLISEPETREPNLSKYKIEIIDYKRLIKMIMGILILIKLHMNLAIENESTQIAFNEISMILN